MILLIKDHPFANDATVSIYSRKELDDNDMHSFSIERDGIYDQWLYNSRTDTFIPANSYTEDDVPDYLIQGVKNAVEVFTKEKNRNEIVDDILKDIWLEGEENKYVK